MPDDTAQAGFRHIANENDSSTSSPEKPWRSSKLTHIDSALERGHMPLQGKSLVLPLSSTSERPPSTTEKQVSAPAVPPGALLPSD